MNTLFEEISKLMIVKKRALLGFEAGDDHHVSILNRLVDCRRVNGGCGDDRLRVGPATRRPDRLAAWLGQVQSERFEYSGREAQRLLRHGALQKDLVTTYRSCTMRLAYQAADLPMLQFSANRLARGMNAPTVGHWNRLKRAGRFLKGHPRWSQWFIMQEMCSYVRGFGRTLTGRPTWSTGSP